MKKFLISLTILSAVTLPVFVYADTTVAPPTGKSGLTWVCTGPNPGDCSFDKDVIPAIQNLLNWGRDFALAFSVVVLAVAGFRYMISGDNAGERKKANDMLWKVVLGIVFILAAWLIVTLILNALQVTKTVNFTG